MLRCTCVFALALTSVYPAFSQEELSPGQQKMQALSFMIGDWEYKDADGAVRKQSINWINNKSFIERREGNVREIFGWDLKNNQYTAWTFGGIGGHGQAVGAKKGDGWFFNYQPYYVADGRAVVSFATVTPKDKDTIHVVGQFDANKFDLKLKRIQPTPDTKSLAFLIGKWEGTAKVGDDESKSSVEFEWMTQKNFLRQTISLGETEIVHVIGWNPTTNSMKTWGFGGQGGHGEMTWTKLGENHWREESKNWVTPDGADAHFLLETKVTGNQLHIDGFFLRNGEKTDIVIRASK